jgi:hypothetical protein
VVLVVEVVAVSEGGVKSWDAREEGLAKTAVVTSASWLRKNKRIVDDAAVC